MRKRTKQIQRSDSAGGVVRLIYHELRESVVIKRIGIGWLRLASELAFTRLLFCAECLIYDCISMRKK